MESESRHGEATKHGEPPGGSVPTRSGWYAGDTSHTSSCQDSDSTDASVPDSHDGGEDDEPPRDKHADADEAALHRGQGGEQEALKGRQECDQSLDDSAGDGVQGWASGEAGCDAAEGGRPLQGQAEPSRHNQEIEPLEDRGGETVSAPAEVSREQEYQEGAEHEEEQEQEHEEEEQEEETEEQVGVEAAVVMAAPAAGAARSRNEIVPKQPAHPLYHPIQVVCLTLTLSGILQYYKAH
jgi:hypothetical protein